MKGSMKFIKALSVDAAGAESKPEERSPSPATLELRKVHIAIASDSLRQRSYLENALKDRGLKVVLSESLHAGLIDRLAASEAEVLILDLHDDIEHDEAVLDALLDDSPVPIVFNDISALTLREPRSLARWHTTLLRKIVELASRESGIEVNLSEGMDSGMYALDSGSIKLGEDRVFPGQTPKGEVAMNVWVLGASLGGPEALKRFLAALPADIPAAFVLAQHLGTRFVGLLAEQLDRETPLRVCQPQVGHVLRHGQVLLAPVEERLVINSVGTVELHPAPSRARYTPSIDMVIEDVARRYPARSGVILFSGLGDDGREGIREMHRRGGLVWAQDGASCVMSSMPDAARATGLVALSASPEELAQQLVKHFNSLN